MHNRVVDLQKERVERRKRTDGVGDRLNRHTSRMRLQRLQRPTIACRGVCGLIGQIRGRLGEYIVCAGGYEHGVLLWYSTIRLVGAWPPRCL